MCEEFVCKTVRDVHSSFGRIDYAVNVAGTIGKFLATEEVEFEEFRRVQGINVDGVFLCEREELRCMLGQDEVAGYTFPSFPPFSSYSSFCFSFIDYWHNVISARGSIVNVASLLGSRGAARSMPYVVSKHSIIGMTKSDAIAYASQGIRVNCVSPGFSILPTFQSAFIFSGL